MITRLRTTSYSRSHGGFTLLEVLVALFILLVGGLAIMNIFPPALRVIQGSGNREVALAMTRSTLERFVSEPNSVPDAIYNGDDDGVWQDITDRAVVGSSSRNKSIPKPGGNYTDSALAAYRCIRGERHKVLTYGSGPQPYVLLNQGYANPSSALAPRVWREEFVDGVTVNSAGELDFTNAYLRSDPNYKLSAPEYGGIDVNENASYLRRDWRNTSYRYYVSYRWQNASATDPINGVLEEPLYIPTISPPTALTSTIVFRGGTNPILSGGVDFLVQIPVVVDTSSTEYDGNTYPNLGLLLLAPGSASAGQEVAVDYTVGDWRNLVQEAMPNVLTSKGPDELGTVAANQAYDVRLNIPTLNTSIAPPTAPLYGLMYSALTTGPNPQTGYWRDNDADGKADPNGVIVNVNPSAATFNVGTPTPSNLYLRVVYGTERQWAQQLSVAARTYYPYDSSRLPPNPREEWREYYSNGAVLEFQPSEVGKTVLVSFIYDDGSKDVTVTDQIVVIDDKPRTSTNLGFTRVARAELLLPDGSAPNVRSILSVKGASVRSRVAWIEGKKWVQEAKEDFRPLD